MSTAIFTAAAAVRLASRVWSMYSRPRSMVNSRSLDVAVVLLELLADAQELGVRGRHLDGHLGDLGSGPDAGHDVLALASVRYSP